MCQSVSQLSLCLFLSVHVHVKGDVSPNGGREASHLYCISRKYVSEYLSSITILHLKALANACRHQEWAVSLILYSMFFFFCVLSVSVCLCVVGSIGQLAGCGLQRWQWSGGSGGETAGVATIGSQVLCVTSTPPLPRTSAPPSLLSPFCQGERWHLLLGEADSSHAHQSHCHSPSRHH